jgi:hypothetical protein
MNENQENLTDKTVPDDAHVTSAEGGAAVSNALSLAELNQTLGKDFKDKETALKALKDTQSYVGKKIAAVSPAPAVDPNLASKVQTLETQVFYANNPEFKGHEAIINAMGTNPAEVVGSDAFKTYFEKAKVADEVANNKSIVSSNSRLSQAKSVTEQAIQVTNARGSTNEDTALVFASAINAANNER